MADHLSAEGKSIYNKYLKFQTGETFLFGKGTFAENKFVWYATDKDSYTSGEITGESGPNYNVRLTNGTEVTVEKSKADFINPPKFDGVEDCAELSYLSEAAVLHNLKKRYDADIIYTYSGLFLVVVNPYKRLPIYDPEIVELYRGKRRNEVPPHVFALSDTAYRNMLNEHQNQSILITGESGAGKTENTKKVIQYLAGVAGRQGGGKLEEQVLQANPILESFGNAKTLRNNNSSRFGKFIEIQFSTSGFISGASIVSYLLEKSRVIKQAENERSFHIFYQLTAGANEEQKKKWHVQKQNTYNTLKNSNCYTVNGVDDAKDFADLTKSMEIMSFTSEEIQSVYGVIAGILQLGNIAIEGGVGETSAINNKDALNWTSEILGLDAGKLELGITRPRIKAGNDIVQTHLDQDKAAFSRDALCKALYHRLFLWIVTKINSQLSKERSNQFIGVLDIAGFEIFKINSFDQLSINYTNERLQQFFNHHMFTLEQEEYTRERIEWEFIDFGLDLAPTIDLIEKKPMGILALLDEESLFPRATDTTFLNKLHQQFDAKGHPKYLKPRFSKTAFGVAHYAGDVEYEVAGWLEKNKDPLQEDLITCMKKSDSQLVATLFTQNLTGVGEVDDPKARRGKGANFVTVGGQHKEQLLQLMATLGSTHPHFVRCIIPNHAQKPGGLEDTVVLDQLRCNGVLEGIRISRKGFPNRIPYPEFLKRYYLLGKNIPRSAPDARAATAALIDEVKLNPETFRFGVTKIFFKAGQLALIEEMREKKIGELLISIQSAARGYLSRQQYKRMTQKTVAVKVIQRNIRAWVGFKNWQWWKLFSKVRPMLKRRNIEKELAEKAKEIAALAAKADAESKTRAALEKQLKELEDNLAEVNQKLKKERDNASELAEDKSLLEEEKSDLARRMKKLEEDLADYQKDVSDLEKDKDSARSGLKDVTSKYELEQQARANLEKAQAELRAQLDKLKELHDEESAEITKLRRAKDGLEAQVEELMDSVETEGKQRSGLDKLKAKLEGEVDELTERLENELKNKNNLDKEKKKLEASLAELKTKFDAESASKTNEESAKKKLQVEYNQLKEDYENESKKASNLEKVKKGMDDELEDLKDRVESLTDTKASLEKSRRSLEDELEDLKDKRAEDEDEKKRLQDLVRKYEAEIADLRSQLEAANAQIAKLEKLKEGLERQLSEISSSMEGEVKDKSGLEKLKKRLETELQTLTERLESEVKDRVNLEKEKKKADDSLRETRQKLEDEQSARNNQEQLNKKLEQAMIDLRGDLEKEVAKREETEKSKKSLQNQLEDLKEQLSDTADDKESVARSKKKAEEELESLKDRLEEEEAKSDKLSKSLKQKEVDLENANANLAKDADARNKLDAQVKSLLRENEQFKSNEASGDSARSELDKEKRRLDAEVKQLQNDLDSEQKEKKKLAALRTKLEQDLQSAQSKIGEESLVISQFDAKVKRLEDDLAEVKDQLEKANSSKNNSEKSKKTLQQQLEELQEQLDDEQRLRIKAEKLARELEDDMEDLKEKAEESASKKGLEELRNKQEQEIELMKFKMEREVELRRKAEEALSVFKQQNELLNEQFENESRSKEKQDKARAKLQADVEELTERLEQEKKKRESADRAAKEAKNNVKTDVGPKIVPEELKAIQTENDELKAKLEASQANHALLEKKRKQAEDERDELKEQFEDEVASKEKALKAKKQLEDEIDQLNERLEDEERKFNDMEDQKHKREIEIEEL